MTTAHGMCLNKVYLCPYCKCIHGGTVTDGVERKCSNCPHSRSCEYEGYADVEEKLCESAFCFFQWFNYNARLHLNI